MRGDRGVVEGPAVPPAGEKLLGEGMCQDRVLTGMQEGVRDASGHSEVAWG